MTVTGGKWTTYRAMAEDVLDKAFQRALLERRPSGVTTNLRLLGAEPANSGHTIGAPPGLHSYGSERDLVSSLPGSDNQIGGGLSEAMIRFGARYEYARTVEDVLARRSRLLFLDADLAGSLAAKVSAILSDETGVDPQTKAFNSLARHYRHLPD
jgi:glycerol-3-phosphate dehydrogenase